MTKTITWTTGTEKKATVTVSLQTSKTVNVDGDKAAVDCCELHISAEVEGMGTVGYGEPQTMKSGPAAGRIGKLGLTAENLARVEAAIDEVKATPEGTATQAAEAQGEVEEREYRRSTERINAAMSGSY